MNVAKKLKGMKNMNFKLMKIVLTLLILVSVSSSCEDKDMIIPYVYVHFEVYLDDPNRQDLIPIGGTTFVDGYGHRGILIYHYSNEEYWAYDRACTYHPNENCSITDGSNWSTVACSCCDSEYSLFSDGLVSKGPAKFALHKYRVSYNQGARILTISN